MYLLRSRWAAIGAAVAVTLGAGGLISVGASNDTSSLVPITPTRVLDTRSGDRVGSLDTAGASDPYRLKVTGGNGIPASGVTAVSLNVTAVGTQTNDYGGFLSVYPCASVSTTKPDVSNMNFGSGQTIANAVTVPVSADGHICLYVYGTAHLLVDANGFYTSSTAGAVDAVVDAYTKAETDTKLGTKADRSFVRELATSLQTPLAIDADGDVGGHTSIAIGENGYPIISYFDETNDDLKVAACATVGCTGEPVITTIDSSGSVGHDTSIAIGENGLPVISYRDLTNNSLKVAACTTTDCSGNPTLTSVDGTDTVGRYTSIAIRDNGLPIISYFDETNNDLKVAACATTDCSGTPTLTTVDDTGIVGWYTSIAIRDNGLPIISYYDNDNESLEVAACSTTDCSGTPTITTVDDDGWVGHYTTIVIGNDGKPIISYQDVGQNRLKVAACAATDCTGTATITSFTPPGAGRDSSIAIGGDGNPVISSVYYPDGMYGDLIFVACETTSCSESTVTTVDHPGDTGLHTSITVTDSNVPVISYYHWTEQELRVVPVWTHAIPE